MPTPFLPQLGMLMQKAQGGAAPPQETPLQRFIREQKEAQGNIFLPIPSAESMGPLPPEQPTNYTPLPTNAGALYDNRPKISPANQFNTKPMPQTGAEPFGQRVQNVEDLVKMIGGMTPTPRNQPEVMMGGDPEKGPLQGLYSRLTRQFEAVPAKQLHPNKIASMFQQVPEEAQFTGASKFAQGNTPVPTQQIVEHLRENPIQLGEKVLSDQLRNYPEGPLHERPYNQFGVGATNYEMPSPGEGYNTNPFRVMKAPDRPQYIDPEDMYTGPPAPLYNVKGPHVDAMGVTHEQALDLINNARPGLKLAPENPPEYTQYTLPGAVKGTNQERVISWKGPFPNANEQTSQGTIYRSGDPHFQSHAFNTPNTQVWSRSNIHETPQGPFKFLEEIQSDWHQKGKDQGYQGAPDPADAARVTELTAQLEQHNAETARLQGLLDANRNDFLDRQQAETRQLLHPRYAHLQTFGQALREGRDAVDTWRAARTAANGQSFALEHMRRVEALLQGQMGDHLAIGNGLAAERSGLLSPKGVPDSPFKTSWADLALKRELHDAASKDLSGISWTPGRVQNQRWDLGQVADSLRWNPESLILSGRGPNGVFQYTPTLEQPLESYVGKGMAEHLRANPRVDVQTKGLDVGGAGMRQFYDQEVPRKLEKLVAPYGGGKVEPVGHIPIIGESSNPIFRPAASDDQNVFANILGMRLTPELKRAILSKGFPLLSILGGAAEGFGSQLDTLQKAAKPLDTAPPKR